MRWFFDTSVLIPTFLEDHEHHEASLDAFLKSDRRSSCCAAHSLAEVYSALTRLPGQHRLSGEQVLLFLENIRERLTLVTLDPQGILRSGAGSRGERNRWRCDLRRAPRAMRSKGPRQDHLHLEREPLPKAGPRNRATR